MIDTIYKQLRTGEICSIYTCEDCCNIPHIETSIIAEIFGTYKESHNLIFKATEIQHAHDKKHLTMYIENRPDLDGREDSVPTLILDYDKVFKDDKLGIEYRNLKCPILKFDAENHKFIFDYTP